MDRVRLDWSGEECIISGGLVLEDTRLVLNEII